MPPTNTPLRTTTSHPASHHSSHHSETVAGASGTISVAQRDLEKAVRDEIFGAVLEQEETRLPLVPEASGLVNDVVREFSPQPLEGWPTSGAEAQYYKPIETLIHKILQHMRSHADYVNNGHYHGYSYFPHESEMRDKIDGAAPLKPDGIFAPAGLYQKNRMSWRDVAIGCEVKRSWLELVLQAGTYARAMFATNTTRLFALVIGINQSKREARFLFFHRGGLVSSKLLALGTGEGFRSFVSILTRVMSAKDAVDAGYLRPCKGKNPFRDARFLSTRTCIRGSANLVGMLCHGKNDSSGRVPHTVGMHQNMRTTLAGGPAALADPPRSTLVRSSNITELQ